MRAEEEILKSAIDKWGTDIQALMLIEEMSELTKALIKYWRNQEINLFDHIAEEVADVEIMLAQLKIIFEGMAIDTAVKEYKQIKLMRLEQRLNEKEGE